MSSAQPAAPRVPKASVLAALQLVEDARYLGFERRPSRERARLVAERTLASRRLARDLHAAR